MLQLALTGLDAGRPRQCATHAEWVQRAREAREACEITPGCERPAAYLIGLDDDLGGWVEVGGRRTCWGCDGGEIARRCSESRVRRGGQP